MPLLKEDGHGDETGRVRKTISILRNNNIILNFLS